MLTALLLLPFLVVAEDPTAIADGVPWPVTLATSGATLAALIAFFVWQNRQISQGRWYPAPIVEKMLAEKDAVIAGHVKTIEGKDILIGEQQKTIRSHESTAATSAKALEQSTSNQGWIDVLVRKSLGESADVPQKGHNGPEEVSS